MRILLVHADLTARGGAEAYAGAIANWLIQDGHRVDHLDVNGLARHDGGAARPWPLRLGTVPGLRRFGLFKYALVCRVLPGIATSYDRVILTYGEGPALDRPVLTLRHAPALFSRDRRALAALGTEPGRSAVPLAPRRLYTRCCVRIAGIKRIADGPTLANSNWTAALVQQLGGQRPDVLYPPIRPQPTGTDRRALAGLIAMSRIVPNKRLEDAIAILGRLRAQGHPATLDIVGRAGSRYARRLIARHRATPGLRFHADADDRTLEELLQRARFGLHCYRHEHFGIAVAEMITAGVLPVVHDSGGVREIVTDPALRFRDVPEAADRLAQLIATPDHATAANVAALREGRALNAALDFERRLAGRLATFLRDAA